MSIDNMLFPEWNKGVCTFDNIYDELERKFKTRIICLPQMMMGGVSHVPTSCDIIDDEDKFLILIDMPRVRRNEISMYVEESSVSIIVVHEENEEEKTSKYVQKEHGDFRFSRKFGLPQKIIRKRVSAKLKNGILTVTLPKMKLIPQPSSQIIID